MLPIRRMGTRFGLLLYVQSMTDDGSYRCHHKDSIYPMGQKVAETQNQRRSDGGRTMNRHIPASDNERERALFASELPNCETLRCPQTLLSGGRKNPPVCRALAGLTSCSFNFPATVQRTALGRAKLLNLDCIMNIILVPSVPSKRGKEGQTSELTCEFVSATKISLSFLDNIRFDG